MCVILAIFLTANVKRDKLKAFPGKIFVKISVHTRTLEKYKKAKKRKKKKKVVNRSIELLKTMLSFTN